MSTSSPHPSAPLILPADIWLGEGIQPDGQRLVSQPLGMDYFNPIDGRRVLLDAVTNAAVRLTASNEIINSNYFTRHGKSDRGEKAEYANTID